MSLLSPQWFTNYKAIYKNEGIKALFKKGGGKLIIGFFVFYLIRDVTLYIIPLYLASKGIVSCF